MHPDECLDMLDKLQEQFNVTLEAMRKEVRSATRLRDVVQDFDRGVVTLPELLKLVRED